MKQWMIAIKLTAVLTLVTGIVYPLAVTGIAQVFFPAKANGSLVTANGKAVGSALIGQNFSRPEYFHGRPSATGDKPYDGLSSGGSNLGPTNQKLIDRVKADVAKFRAENPDYQGPIPADLLTASASGLDPDISPESAAAQIERVARARGVAAQPVRKLAAHYTEGRYLGIFGEPRVNVLRLNLALDRGEGVW
jgi:potassium-transporting ATPase KdpC subunit